MQGGRAGDLCCRGAFQVPARPSSRCVTLTPWANNRERVSAWRAEIEGFDWMQDPFVRQGQSIRINWYHDHDSPLIISRFSKSAWMYIYEVYVHVFLKCGAHAQWPACGPTFSLNAKIGSGKRPAWKVDGHFFVSQWSVLNLLVERS